MSEHTPGPWRAYEPDYLKTTDRELGPYFFIEAGDAALSLGGFHLAGYLTPADAHLIAAAPELLAALIAMDAEFLARDDDPVKARARAAIAKATGGDQ